MRARNCLQASAKATPTVKSHGEPLPKCSALSRVCKTPDFLPKESVAGGERWERDMESLFDGIFILGQSHLQPTHTRSAAASALTSFIVLKGQKIRMKFPLRAQEWPSLRCGRAAGSGHGAAAWAGDTRRVSVQRRACATVQAHGAAGGAAGVQCCVCNAECARLSVH